MKKIPFMNEMDVPENHEDSNSFWEDIVFHLRLFKYFHLHLKAVSNENTFKFKWFTYFSSFFIKLSKPMLLLVESVSHFTLNKLTFRCETYLS